MFASQSASINSGACAYPNSNLAHGERRPQFSMSTNPSLIPPITTLPERIGNTPLIRMGHIVREFKGITLLGKAEWANPGGSVKDRAAASMVRDARARGLLTPGKTLLDATSGNTGIAFAMLGAALGFPVHLAMPSSVNVERKRILRAYGAQIDWTDPDQGSDGAIRRAREAGLPRGKARVQRREKKRGLDPEERFRDGLRP